MNAKNHNLNNLSLDALIAMKTAGAAITAAVAEEVEAIRELSGNVVEAKNAADAGTAFKSSLWSHVYNVAAKVAEMTAETPDIRYQVFTDALAEFLIPKTGDDGKPVKLSTAGQYASTGRKMLVTLVTDKGRDVEEFRGKTRKEIMDEFKDTKDAALLTSLSETSQRLRYVVKHGTPEEKARLAGLFSEAEKLWMPIKARKDKSKNAAKADATLRDNRQQAPSESATLETVASEVIGEGAEDAGNEKVAVNQ